MENPLSRRTLWIAGLSASAAAIGLGVWALTSGGNAQAATAAGGPQTSTSGGGTQAQTPTQQPQTQSSSTQTPPAGFNQGDFGGTTAPDTPETGNAN